MIDETLFDAEEKMEKAVSVARDDLSSIRTGRANPGMFARVNMDYYGSPTPITQLSSINVPEPRLVVIKPYEANQLRNIEDAIRNQNAEIPAGRIESDDREFTVLSKTALRTAEEFRNIMLKPAGGFP